MVPSMVDTDCFSRAGAVMTASTHFRTYGKRGEGRVRLRGDGFVPNANSRGGAVREVNAWQQD